MNSALLDRESYEADYNLMRVSLGRVEQQIKDLSKGVNYSDDVHSLILKVNSNMDYVQRQTEELRLDKVSRQEVQELLADT